MNQTRNSRQRSFNRPAHQRGVATILIVLMVGLAVSVTVAAALYALRGNQQRQLASHSATSAQASAWRGAEFMRTLVQDIVNKEEIATGKFLYNLSFGLSGSGTCIPANPGEGCEMPSIPAWDSETQWVASTDWVEVPADIGDVVPAGNPGFTAAITQVRRMPAFHTYQVKARITGEAGGDAVSGTIQPMATSVLEVVYDVRPPVGTAASWSCPAVKSAMVFNGDLDYSGGKLDIENSERALEDIVVAGKLSVGGGSSAKISGCIKGDVTLSGGGIVDNGHLYSEGTISINGMGSPNNAALWARSISVGSGTSGGSYSKLKVGAYQADVYAEGRKIGTTRIGGGLIPTTAGPVIPWVSGTVIPRADNGNIVITTAVDSFVLDLAKVAIDSGTGIISGAKDAERLSGTGAEPLPDILEFRATGIHGGDIHLAAAPVIIQLWGYGVNLNSGSWNGRYDTLWAAGNIAVSSASASVGELSGGGNLAISGGGAAVSEVVRGGVLAGKWNGPLPPGNVQVDVSNASPGLPGTPWCDARVKPVDVDLLKEQANYVFEVLDGKPTLTIQNVNKADGDSIAGRYELQSLNEVQRQVVDGLFQCSTGTGKGTVCFGHDGTNWNLSALTRVAPGVMWFDSALRLSSENKDALVATLIGKGDFILTDRGGGTLTAPNHSTVERVCRGLFHPSSLCEKKNGVMEFVEWIDATTGKKYPGSPLASSSVVSEGGLSAEGWKLYGNVVLGKNLSAGNGGAELTIHGTLTVGSNQTANSKITAGGMNVVVQSMDSGHNVSPICSGSTAVIGRPTSVLWSRYL